MGKDSISAIILNWNNAPDTIRCLTSIFESVYKLSEIIVVDNGSSDDSVFVIQEKFPDITILENEENLGYAQGNNVGIKYAVDHRADLVLLLNDDTVIAPDMILEMVKVMDEDPMAGIVGPKIFNLENPIELLTVGADLKPGCVIENPAMGMIDQGQWDNIAEVGYLWGCAVIVRKKVIEEVGMLDPDFFAYQEDVDWCYRIKNSGFKCLFVPKAKCWHPDTRTGRENSPLVTYYMSRNHLLFLLKHNLGIKELVLSIGVYIRRILSWTIRPKWRKKVNQRNALVRALIDFSLGRYGRAKGFG